MYNKKFRVPVAQIKNIKLNKRIGQKYPEHGARTEKERTEENKRKKTQDK